MNKDDEEENSVVCDSCGQKDEGQTGEYPCDVCGLPRTWDEKEEFEIMSVERLISILSQYDPKLEVRCASYKDDTMYDYEPGTVREVEEQGSKTLLISI